MCRGSVLARMPRSASRPSLAPPLPGLDAPENDGHRGARPGNDGNEADLSPLPVDRDDAMRRRLYMAGGGAYPLAGVLPTPTRRSGTRAEHGRKRPAFDPHGALRRRLVRPL